MILVQHVGGSGLDLRIQNGEPELLGLNRLSALSFAFVFRVQVFELLSVNISKAWSLVGTEERPGSVVLDTFHKQIGDPKGIEQIACTVGFVTVVLAQVQKLKDVCMPWFQVNGNASLALASSLVDVTSSVVEDAQHGNNTVGGSVGTANVGLTGTNVVYGKPNSSGILRNDRAILERVVNTIDRVLFHGQEEARGHLSKVGTRIEQGRGGVGVVALRQVVVCLNDRVHVVSMDTKRHTHQHALRPLRNLAVHFQKVGLFQRLESEVVVLKVAGMDDGSVQLVFVFHYRLVEFLGDKGSWLSRLWVNVVVECLGEFREATGCHFVQVGDNDSRRENGIIRMLRGKGSCGLCCESEQEREQRGRRRKTSERGGECNGVQRD